jgi:pimeloyl-ACP methyl ester carboxylesterase
MEIREACLRLPDQRLLGYGLYGPPGGRAVFDFHGIPGSRREAAMIASRLERDDICLVGIDRPGYGRSSPRRGFRITDFPADVAALADHLEIGKFIALGYSGGAPFALACAAFLPERVRAVGIVAGVGPAETGPDGMHQANRRKFQLARRFPALARLMLRASFGYMRRHPAHLLRQMEHIWRQMPEPDRRVLADPWFAQGIRDITLDALAITSAGWACEELLMAQPWGFQLEELGGPPVLLWHGGQDRNVPLAMAMASARRIPSCKANYLEEEGHLSLIHDHAGSILDTLLRIADC